MARGWRAVCYSWIAMQIAMVAPVSMAQTHPSTQPSDRIIEIRLEDPLTPDSPCYLDLDTGKTFPRGESALDMLASRQWIHEHGVDLMCESREPADGLIAYDLSLRPNTVDINAPPDFVTLRRMFDKPDAPSFDFVTPGDALPKSYLFRTSDGAMGVLEISEKVEKPSGMRLRYRLVPEPVKAPLVRDPNAQRLGMFVIRVQIQQRQLNNLRATYGDNHPLVQSAQRTLTLYQKIANIAANEKDPRLAALKMSKASQEALLAEVRLKLPDETPQVRQMLERLAVVNKQIADYEAKQGKGANPATQPGAVMPVTRPSVQDFHL